MSRKPHEIVWNKKKGKFFSASVMKPHPDQGASDDSLPPQGTTVGNRRGQFMRSLKDKIKNAVKNAVKNA